MVYLVRLQLVDVERIARVHALAALHEVERQPLVIERARIPLLELGVHVGALRLDAGKRRFQGPVAARGASSLVAGVLVARHLHIDVRGGLAGDPGDLVYDSQRLVDAATQSGRARHLVDRHAAYRKRALAVVLVDLRLKLQQIVVQYLHKVHGRPHAPRMVRVAFQKDVHNGFRPVVSSAAQPA